MSSPDPVTAAQPSHRYCFDPDPVLEDLADLPVEDVEQRLVERLREVRIGGRLGFEMRLVSRGGESNS